MSLAKTWAFSEVPMQTKHKEYNYKNCTLNRKWNESPSLCFFVFKYQNEHDRKKNPTPCSTFLSVVCYLTNNF